MYHQYHHQNIICIKKCKIHCWHHQSSICMIYEIYLPVMIDLKRSILCKTMSHPNSSSKSWIDGKY